jgi:hypothetical protein
MRSPETLVFPVKRVRLWAWEEYYGAVLKNANRNKTASRRSTPANIKSVG